jgi:L-alanine-DL-glutamate epimerase-like enolase superfamily enzyme
MVTPIAAGEDVYGAQTVSDLVTGIDILRVDATTMGGITGAIEAIALAAGRGRTVLPHVFWPLHVHLASAFPAVEGVEVIPATFGADPLDRLLAHMPVTKDGKMIPNGQREWGSTSDGMRWSSLPAATPSYPKFSQLVTARLAGRNL